MEASGTVMTDSGMIWRAVCEGDQRKASLHDVNARWNTGGLDGWGRAQAGVGWARLTDATSESDQVKWGKILSLRPLTEEAGG